MRSDELVELTRSSTTSSSGADLRGALVRPRTHPPPTSPFSVCVRGLGGSTRASTSHTCTCYVSPISEQSTYKAPSMTPRHPHLGGHSHSLLHAHHPPRCTRLQPRCTSHPPSLSRLLPGRGGGGIGPALSVVSGATVSFSWRNRQPSRLA